MTLRHLLALSILCLLTLAACSGGEEQGGPPQLPVTVAPPLVREITEWDDYVGRFEAVDSVEVRPRASGYLQRAHFTDGQYVRAGQLLFTIDARPAQAALDQARAQRARALATLANAKTELARSETLAKSQAASQEEVEQRRAAVRTSEADVAAASAAIRAAELNVGFTRVVAPISGRVSQRLVDPGNAVTADQTILTTVVSTSPIHFSFQGSEASLLEYERRGDTLVGSPVRIKLQGAADYSIGGRIDFVDNALSNGSGTITVRAVVQNPDGALRPGLFGQLQLAASAPRAAFLLPDTAIVTDGPRRVVYVIGPKDVVQARPVQLGPVIGNLQVIRSGVTAKDRIIVGGIQRAMPGKPAKVQAGRIGADGKVIMPKGPPPAKGEAKAGAAK
ncbi:MULTISPECIES: efflux RND transporter periplasmic adaptor subunit [unclassified Sphingopyxis]|uniref:efflux RND transporter periplasmic adaptor subunit n=1 Tax=unclassified Sphingopyxis TaxID=2614943 RepID=UPI0007360446|nr:MULTISPECIES: efflux RND transporter periplasmic adaptor subunit [unclassified Sphingopyxis]KTE46588.1 hemolysin secretion protein D [Sphingopyxis sp. HIX]KTE84451.1 hemolysin secretion protein D [Sphingopyxis sp. HXXIV]